MSWDDYGYDWDDCFGENPEPVLMMFDRIITTTEKAVLFGRFQYMFWVPKSVYSLITAPDADAGIVGTIAVEGWATINKSIDPAYSPPGKLHKGKLTEIEQDVVDETLGDTL